MPRIYHKNGLALAWATLTICMVCAGCELSQEALRSGLQDVPHELKRVAQPPYVIESPDELLIDAVRLVPRPPYRIEPLDLLTIVPAPKIPYRIAPLDFLDIQVSNTLPGAPITGGYIVEATGSVNLRYTYGTVSVVGQTLDEARASIQQHLTPDPKKPGQVGKLKPPFEVSVSLVEARILQQLRGDYGVNPEGKITLPGYGTIPVVGMTLDEAKTAVESYLARPLGVQILPFEVTVGLAQSRGTQQIKGPHLVRPDGTVSLGTYGSVFVDGLTLAEAKAAIEAQLSTYLLNPKIALDVSGYNSKVFYVITDGAGFGEQVIRLPSTGKETVLDAISFIGGLPAVASKRNIWLARPAPSETNCVQTLPIDWVGITQRGATATNYQVLPGDRIYVKAASVITMDTWLQRIISPIERVFGIALLARTTIRNYESNFNSGTGTGTGVGR
ncbi:MAG TPA: polysaccharide biosynthesis/export family protein [Gemmataceae bacterium]|nr:polysaccharide biosynthesis/export family protein [Gemmataceae bacterium]